MKKVIIIEDEPMISKFYAQSLKTNGFDVRCAESIKEGLNIKNFKADLLLIDHGLQDGEGIDAIPKFKKVFPNAKIIIFSNYSDFSFKKKALAKGAHDFWVKSRISLADLPKMVNEII